MQGKKFTNDDATHHPATHDDISLLLIYKNSDEFREAYRPDYLQRLLSFTEEVSETLYNHHFKEGNIKFQKDQFSKHMDNTIAQMIYARNVVSNMVSTDCKFYDILSPKQKYLMMEGIGIAEKNLARMGSVYGY